MFNAAVFCLCLLNVLKQLFCMFNKVLKQLLIHVLKQLFCAFNKPLKQLYCVFDKRLKQLFLRLINVLKRFGWSVGQSVCQFVSTPFTKLTITSAEAAV